MALRYMATRGDIGSRLQSRLACTACGERLQEISYQARSADEPPRTIVLCLRCPLNPERLTAGGRRVTVDYGQGHPCPRARSRAPKVIGHRNSDSMWVLCTSSVGEGAVSQAVENSDFTVLRRSRLICTCSDDPHLTLRPELVDTNDGTYTRTLQTWSVAPGVTLREITRYKVPSLEESAWITTAMVRHNVNLNGVRVSVETQDDGTNTLYYETGTVTDRDLRKFVSAVYFAGAGPQSLDACWKFGKVRSLLCARPRSHDSASASNGTHLFTTKPDGQRCIVARLGCVWGYFRSDNNARFIGWSFGSLKSGKELGGHVGAVMDAELVGGQLPIFIDLLQRDDSSLIEEARHIGKSLSDAKSLADVAAAVSFREYFTEVEEASLYRKRAAYPCDGLIAIHTNGVEMKKLKELRSIEVLHVGGGATATGDGVPFFSHPALAVHPEGAIVELRVLASLGHRSGVPTIEVTCADSFVRTDKESANSTAVCLEIVRVALGSTQESSLVRRHVVVWCRKLFGRLLQTAFRVRSAGNVIVDFGTGDGQVTGSYAEAARTCGRVGVLMVESCATKARLLFSSLRGKRCKYASDYAELIPLITKLRNLDVEYVVFHGDANALVRESDVYRVIKSNAKCVVSGFSISHVLPAMEKLALDGIPCIGCGYLYDKVGPGECLVDTGGIRMRRISNEEAEVKWGRDPVYRERAVATVDFSFLYSVEQGGAVVPLQVGGDEAEIVQTCRSICSSVYVIKHMC